MTPHRRAETAGERLPAMNTARTAFPGLTIVADTGLDVACWHVKVFIASGLQPQVPAAEIAEGAWSEAVTCSDVI